MRLCPVRDLSCLCCREKVDGGGDGDAEDEHVIIPRSPGLPLFGFDGVMTKRLPAAFGFLGPVPGLCATLLLLSDVVSE